MIQMAILNPRADVKLEHVALVSQFANRENKKFTVV
jgi:hypothetical protein